METIKRDILGTEIEIELTDIEIDRILANQMDGEFTSRIIEEHLKAESEDLVRNVVSDYLDDLSDEQSDALFEYLMYGVFNSYGIFELGKEYLDNISSKMRSLADEFVKEIKPSKTWFDVEVTLNHTQLIHVYALDSDDAERIVRDLRVDDIEWHDFDCYSDDFDFGDIEETDIEWEGCSNAFGYDD